MTSRTRHLVIAAALAAFGAALGGASFSAAADTDAPASVVRAVRNGHAYQNGGIGQDEVAAMDQHMQPYNLRLTFSEGHDNAFATGIELKIFNAQGQRVFGLRDAGPMTDVALPPGTYKIQANFGGVERTGTAVVKAGQPASVALHWSKDET